MGKTLELLKLKRWVWVVTIGLSLHSFLALGFENDYIKFDLPTTWTCSQEKISWTCSPQSTQDVTEAIIVVTAKEPGPEDNMPLYLKHLGQPKMLMTAKNTTPQPSKVIQAKVKMIGPQQWVEGLHLSSEVKDFYTLYLATKAQGLSILLSLSADKRHTSKYNQTFKNVVESVRIKKLPLRKRLLNQTKTGIDAVDQTVQNAVNNAPSGYSVVDRVLSSRLLTALSFAFFAMLLGIVVYLVKK